MEAVRTLLGTSLALREVVEDAEAVAATNSKVLITGESGVGKEVLARLIHRRSQRSQRPIVTINCAGIAETLLESEFFGHVRGSFTGAHRDRKGFLETAHGGTVLLDEVGEMSLRMQRMLLRFLENGEIQPVGSDRPQTVVDVRVIAATNRDLLEQVRLKEFREDLYYRLNIVHLVIPPLRERREDIPVLLRHFLAEISEQNRIPVSTINAELMQVLELYDWPGNVRELRNVAERLLLTRAGRGVTVADLPLKVLQRDRPVASANMSTAAVAVEMAKTPEGMADACYRQMASGEASFWTAVCEPFMSRDLTRETVRAVVRRGLEQTRGNYRLVAQLFNLPAGDYKRFLNFLQKYECHMPFQRFRIVSAGLDRRLPPPSDVPAAIERSA